MTGFRAAVAALFALSGVARAEDARTRVTVEDFGTTYVTHLDTAPYPDPMNPVWANTVLVFVPEHFQPEPSVSFVVHFHGFATTPSGGVEAMRGRQQLVLSGRNAILVSPQCPMSRRATHSGKLARPGGFRRLLEDVVRFLEARGHVAAGAQVGPVLVTAHSGAFEMAADAILQGDAPVVEVAMLDALYGRHDAFAEWLSQDPARRFVSLASEGALPDRWKGRLTALLDERGIDYRVERREGQLSRADLTDARVLFLTNRGAHFACVYYHLTLRDILEASPLPRAVDTGWSTDLARRPRLIERYRAPGAASTVARRQVVRKSTPN